MRAGHLRSLLEVHRLMQVVGCVVDVGGVGVLLPARTPILNGSYQTLAAAGTKSSTGR